MKQHSPEPRLYYSHLTSMTVGNFLQWNLDPRCPSSIDECLTNFVCVVGYAIDTADSCKWLVRLLHLVC